MNIKHINPIQNSTIKVPLSVNQNVLEFTCSSCLKTYYFPLRSILGCLHPDFDQLLNAIIYNLAKQIKTHLMTVCVQKNLKICCERTLVGPSPGLDLLMMSKTSGWQPQRTCSCLPEWGRGLAPELEACGSADGCHLMAWCSFSRCL